MQNFVVVANVSILILSHSIIFFQNLVKDQCHYAKVVFKSETCNYSENGKRDFRVMATSKHGRGIHNIAIMIIWQNGGGGKKFIETGQQYGKITCEIFRMSLWIWTRKLWRTYISLVALAPHSIAQGDTCKQGRGVDPFFGWGGGGGGQE